MMEKAGSFIARLKWKAYFFDEKEHPVNNMNFAFKWNFTPPNHELLSPFESDLYDIIRSINFGPVRNDFQKNSQNLFEMTPEQYKTILTNNVTKAYQKAERSTQLNIDGGIKTISKTLELEKNRALCWKTCLHLLKKTQEEFQT